MKGVIFSIKKNKKSVEDVLNILREGFHGVWQSPSGKKPEDREWNAQQVGTFADYSTLEPGDKVFLFRDRVIYGIGELKIPESLEVDTPALLNYPNSDEHSFEEPEEEPLYKPEEWDRLRVVFPFIPGPRLFEEGIDMDKALSSPMREYFWGLRFWRGFSFRLLGETETEALVKMFLKRFEGEEGLEPKRDESSHMEYVEKNFHGTFSPEFHISKNPSAHLKEGVTFRKENWVHATLIEALRTNDGESLPSCLIDSNRKNVFREMTASPPKPPKWADSIDVVSTYHHPEYEDVTTRYSVFEVKKDEVDSSKVEDYNKKISQVMKYVDFIAQKYTDGDYGGIDAYYVARDFSEEFLEFYTESKEGGQTDSDIISPTRDYIVDTHDVETAEVWDNLKLLKYSWDECKNKVIFSLVDTKDYVQSKL